jgi:hypothetical protein
MLIATGNGMVTTDISGRGTMTMLLLKDHLGSMVAEVLITGSVDASGKVVAGSVVASTALSLGSSNPVIVHGFGPWGNARNATSPLAEGQRGFTGHEHLAELGLIHMTRRAAVRRSGVGSLAQQVKRANAKWPKPRGGFTIR